MSLLNGKQIKSDSIDLGKLSGSGVVSFTSSATMSFDSGAVLNTDTANITGAFSVVNKEYVDGTVSAAIQATTYFADAGLTLSVSGNTFSVLVNSDALEIDGVTNEVSLKSTITGVRTFSNDVNFSDDIYVANDATIDGALTVTGNATIDGDLRVNGTVSYLSTTELLVDDNYITLNAGLTQGSGIDAGLEILRGGSTAASLLWDESAERWSIGLSGSESYIITENGTGLNKTLDELSLHFDDARGVDVDTDGLFIKAGAGLTFSVTGELEVDTTTFGVQGANNGLSVDGNSKVILGGTLSQNTTIEGQSTYDITFTGLSGFNTSVATGSVNTTVATGNVNTTITSGDVNTSAANITMTASADVNVISTGDAINLTVTTGDVNTSAVNTNLTSTGDLNATAANITMTASTGDVNTSAVNTNLTSTGDLNATAANITMTASTAFNLNINNSDLNDGLLALITDVGEIGLVYGGSYSGNFVTHSLVDKGYVMGYVDFELAQFKTEKGEPVYDKSTARNANTNGDEMVDPTLVPSISAANISEKSRFQVFVNGLQVSVGWSTGSEVAGLPAYNNHAVEYDTDGNRLLWQNAANYTLDTNDLVEVYYEAIPQI